MLRLLIAPPWRRLLTRCCYGLLTSSAGRSPCEPVLQMRRPNFRRRGGVQHLRGGAPGVGAHCVGAGVDRAAVFAKSGLDVSQLVVKLVARGPEHPHDRRHCIPGLSRESWSGQPSV
uniref:Uncharacterized protein n=1 Tax=Ixodes ricinus TaxID=34613 RepID=A0A6B0ULL8_IXORI